MSVGEEVGSPKEVANVIDSDERRQMPKMSNNAYSEVGAICGSLPDKIM